MSYRTYINEQDWLGNNEAPRTILEELKRQGCSFDEDLCTPIEGFEVKDFDALVKATESVIIEMVENNPEVANFNDNIKNAKETGFLTFNLQYLSETAYIFWSARLLRLVGEENYYIDYDDNFKQVYKLKPGVKVIFKAY